MRDPKTGEPLRDPENPNFVLTTDQWAKYRDKIVPAAYIYNYGFGTAAAAAGWEKHSVGESMNTVKQILRKPIPDPQIPFAEEGFDYYPTLLKKYSKTK